jgi:hypothetical protein
LGLLEDLAESVDGRVDADADGLIDRLRRRAEQITFLRGIDASVARREREAELLAMLDRLPASAPAESRA